MNTREGFGFWRWPQVRGGTFSAYRILWAVFALLNVVHYARAYPEELAEQRWLQAVHAVGFVPQGDAPQGPSVQPYSPEAKQKIGKTETLVAINGRPLPADRPARTLALKGPEGDVRVSLLRPDDTRHEVTLRRSGAYLIREYADTGLTFVAKRRLEFIFMILASFACGLTSIILFVRRPHDPVCALLAIGLMADSGGNTLLPVDVAVWFGLVHSSVQLIAFALGLIGFPDGRLDRRPLRIAAIVALVGAIVMPSWNVGIYLAPHIFGTLPNGLVFPFLCTMVVSYFGAIGTAVVVRYRSTPAGTTRQQIKFALLGCGIAMAMLIPAFFCENFVGWPETARYAHWLQLFGDLLQFLAFAALTGGLLISLLRYRLYDAESLISRSVAYGALTLLLVAIFAGSEKIIEEVGREYLGQEMGALAAGLGAALAAILVTPLHHRITHWAEHRFQGALVRLRQGLPILVGDIRETATPAELADAMLVRVEAGVRATHGAVVVDGAILDVRDIGEEAVQAWLAEGQAPIDQLDRLDCDRGDPLFPMRVPLHAGHVGLVGWLLLGPRPDGSFYGKDEREALLAIAEPTARALAIAIDRQRRETARQGREDALYREVDRLRAAVERLQARIGLEPAGGAVV